MASSLPTHIATGNMNGDGRDDVIGSWITGVWYRHTVSGNWIKMSTPSNLIAAGRIDSDGRDDLIGTWSSGLWVKNSSTMSWGLITLAIPDDIDAGLYRTGSWDVGSTGFIAPIGGYADGPGSGDYTDLSDEGPGGLNFMYQEEPNLVPLDRETVDLQRVPGPGEPGFVFTKQKHLFPGKTRIRDR
jgi:hypothetical protein